MSVKDFIQDQANKEEKRLHTEKKRWITDQKTHADTGLLTPGDSLSPQTCALPRGSR